MEVNSIREKIQSIRGQAREYVDGSYHDLPDDDRTDYMMDLFDQFEKAVMKRERKQAQILNRMEIGSSSTNTYWLEVVLQEMDSIRRELDMKKKEVAEMMGVRGQTYHLWLTGRSTPSVESQKMIIECFKELIEELKEDDNE